MYSRFSVFSLSLLPGSSYFSKWHPSLFPSYSLLQLWPTASLAFSDTFLSNICSTRPFSDLHRNSFDPVSQLACPDFAEGEPKLSEGKYCSSNALSCMDSPDCALLSVTYAQNRRMYITCNIYILRGWSVSSCLWHWKHFYLNTACKLVFQNKRIIKMREKKREGEYQIYMYLKENTIILDVLWHQNIQGAKCAMAVQWTFLCTSSSLRAWSGNCDGIWEQADDCRGK